jgi:hypothetical protein
MKFIQRLKFYGFGFGLGLMVVYAMFGTRSCTTTNEMKMQELVFQHFDLSEKAQCQLKCLRKNEVLLKIELRHFEVDYGPSLPRKEPCGEYLVKPKKEFSSLYNYQILMYDCDTITTIRDISLTTNTLTCNCR